MHVLQGSFGEGYEHWRSRVRAVESSFLDVWSSPVGFATAVFGLGVGSLVVGRFGPGIGRAADVVALILLGVAVGAARFATRGLDVNPTVEQVVLEASQSRAVVHRALHRLPEPLRAEVLAEVQRVLHVLGGLALGAVTVLMVVAAAVAAVPLFNLTVSLAPHAGGFILGAIFAEAAILVTSFVRLVVQTEAVKLPARVAIVSELDELVGASTRRRED